MMGMGWHGSWRPYVSLDWGTVGAVAEGMRAAVGGLLGGALGGDEALRLTTAMENLLESLLGEPEAVSLDRPGTRTYR
jgi:hypothetical protein